MVLLKSGYRLLNYIINEQLKQIVEQANVLEVGQCGGRKGRCENNDVQKMHLSHMKPTGKKKRNYPVDLDFKNIFNAMSHATLLDVMNMFHIPDFDLFEQICDSATFSLAENDTEITFDTGVAQ